MIKVLSGWLLLALSSMACAQQIPLPPRILDGEALYSLHCQECHTSQVHWRDNKLATNWEGIKAQVRRWESNLRLNWSDREIDEVARYLNTYFYRYPAPDSTALLSSQKRNN